jgi:hypothetical protein
MYSKTIEQILYSDSHTKQTDIEQHIDSMHLAKVHKDHRNDVAEIKSAYRGGGASIGASLGALGGMALGSALTSKKSMRTQANSGLAGMAIGALAGGYGGYRAGKHFEKKPISKVDASHRAHVAAYNSSTPIQKQLLRMSYDQGRLEKMRQERDAYRNAYYWR